MLLSKVCKTLCISDTRSGHIPHITFDIFESYIALSQRPIFQVPLSSVCERLQPLFCILAVCFLNCRLLSVDVLEATGCSIAAFCGMPKGALTHLTLLDSMSKIDGDDNSNRASAIWTRSGKQMGCRLANSKLHLFKFALLDRSKANAAAHKRRALLDGRIARRLLCGQIVGKQAASKVDEANA